MIISYLTMVAMLAKHKRISNIFIALSGDGRLNYGLKTRRMRLPFRSTMTVNVPTGITIPNVSITVTGTAGQLSHTLTTTITAFSNFSVRINKFGLTVPPGSTVGRFITVGAVGDGIATVSLSAIVLPANMVSQQAYHL
ncbi:MAG: hypothetical protein AB1489_20965 [Acidobacteriota bacterium]